MNRFHCGIVGNVCGPFIGPDFGHATGLEVALWGICVSVAVAFVGMAIQAHRSSQVRRNWSLVIAIAFLVAACVISSRSQQRGMVESIEQNREDVEKIRQIQLQRQSSIDGVKAPQKPMEQAGPIKN